ncbi:helix-turn-helix domain-containing protein [Streptomyces sp. NPDC018031]|uniref:helix-turn-helix domain-containing protein n=1 Tax=Streptomyces sp. NPDC018031 TaxID=3365033 RepID=UPI00379FE8E0
MGATMPESTSFGDRLREIRKRRGLTQRALADAAGVSVSTIRVLEQGEHSAPRMETARRLAVALGVPTMRLVSQPRAQSADTDTTDLWEPVRRALLAPTAADAPQEPPTVTGVGAAVDAITPLFSGDRFADLSAALPALLRDAAALGQEGRATRTRLLQLTGWVLTQTRQFDAASAALTTALDNATDQLDGAATVNTLCWLRLRQGRLSDARELAVRWADDIEPRMSRAAPAELATWGWMLLRVSAATIRDACPDEAEKAIRLAHAAAVALGREYSPEGDFLRRFGPVTVKLKRVENAAVAGKPDHVLRLAGRVRTDGMRPTSNNRNRHLLDVADAHARMRDYTEAVRLLTGINASSPEWLPQQRYARDILGRIVVRRRTLTPDIRALADAVRLPM